MTQTDQLSQLAARTAEEGLAWVAAHFRAPVFSTSLGEEDQALTYLIAHQHLPISIFTIDTGRLFAETYDLIALTSQRYRVPIQVYFPDASRVERYVGQNGINAFYTSMELRKECCNIRKVAPLQRALQGADVWITGLRVAQSASRQQMKKVEWDNHYQVIKYNPLLDWSDEQLHYFTTEHNIPVNPLHKKGFASIGCAPCTRALQAGEDARAGRWWWENSTKECGLHIPQQPLGRPA
jgi:phosphoadenosine phosphosulfate reductase